MGDFGAGEGRSATLPDPDSADGFGESLGKVATAEDQDFLGANGREAFWELDGSILAVVSEREEEGMGERI